MNGSSSEFSYSALLREKGNEMYLQAVRTDATLISQKELYTRALNIYQQALQSALHPKEVCSAAKNMAQANWRLALVNQALGMGTSFKQTFFLEAMSCFSRAHKESKVTDSLDKWRCDLEKSAWRCVKDCFDSMDGLAVYEKYRRIVALAEKIDDGMVAYVKCQRDLVKILHDECIRLQESGRCERTLALLGECYRPIEEMKKWCHHKDGPKKLKRLSEANTKEQEVFDLTCTAESEQARKNGDSVLQKALQDEEYITYRVTLQILDYYKQAILLARDKDLEQECIALSCIGQLYHNVLNMKLSAKRYLQKCVELSLAQPKSNNYRRCKWYTESTRILEFYQQEVLSKERKAHEAERAKYLEELKEEIKLLKELTDKHTRFEGDLDFLKAVENTFPPQGPEKSQNKEANVDSEKKVSNDGEDKKEAADDFSSPPAKRGRGGRARGRGRGKSNKKGKDVGDGGGDGEGEVSVKKRLQKIIFLYHPDRQAKHGKKWQVLCEEITKCLTQRYESRKGE